MTPLLDSLEAERNEFPADHGEMLRLIDLLIEGGVYPAELPEPMVTRRLTHLEMVQCWGARWHLYREPHHCPHCGADLRDGVNGPPCKREIGVYDLGRDAVTHLLCPDCGGTFDRRTHRDHRSEVGSNE